MVFLRVKISEDDQFLFRTITEETVDAARTELTQIHDLRQRLRRLKIEGEELAKYGPAKEPAKQGIDSYSTEPIEKGEHYKMDPSGKRTGNGSVPAAKTTLLKTLSDAAEIVHKRRVAERHEQTKAELLEALDLVRGAVMISYPMGLPEWDPELLSSRAALLRREQEAVEGTQMALWFAGKEMKGEEQLKTYIGKTENTTATVRLVAADQGAPSREPVIDEATYKGMLAWSYKKQEQQKALVENQEDDYLDSVWASTKSLKQHLNGTTHIRI